MTNKEYMRHLVTLIPRSEDAHNRLLNNSDMLLGHICLVQSVLNLKLVMSKESADYIFKFAAIADMLSSVTRIKYGLDMEPIEIDPDLSQILLTPLKNEKLFNETVAELDKNVWEIGNLIISMLSGTHTDATETCIGGLCLKIVCDIEVLAHLIGHSLNEIMTASLVSYAVGSNP